MLKMFQAMPDSANSPDYWEEAWSQGLEQALSDSTMCENDPLYPLLARTLVRDRIFLEGGCGKGHWVKYFTDREQRTVGVDFASRTVDAIKTRQPALDVRVANILSLPFADGEVHTYYSGGVVEHFESGPMPALREARRVIASDGWFLCSVPDHSLLRNVLFRGDDVERRDLAPPLRVRRVAGTIEETPPPGMRFFQYAFTEAEFGAWLAEAGFEVVETFGNGISWGLFEVPRVATVYAALYRAARRLRPSRPTNESPPASPTVTQERASTGLLGRLILREDVTVPLVGPALRVARQYCSNMRMFVARPKQ